LDTRNIVNALRYTELVEFESDEFTLKATRDTEEARRLMEAGFEYVCTAPDEIKLFRKRK
jgi:hypothetical protein